MRERERRIENGESGTRNVSPSPDPIPNTKLRNNITPINRRLGKNTTPIGRGPTELNQNPQADHRRRRSSLDASFRVDLSYTPRRAESLKYGLHKSQISLGYSAHKASTPGAQQLNLTSSTTLLRPCSLRVRSAQAIQPIRPQRPEPSSSV